ncbi:hypothetical protein LPJ78_002044 [Coemansia sp. RSA 989]|nr:hypothetical protein BX667DRAFT_505364 [Coemansia mojavensis]KAJ1741211.1 hypothetical protein LPJ68_003030 [Coemansia sp. RSA 1086]KAJ1751508.1 hypothetical protein LPJ79_001986 [Coemansia sp. RSA 1821]KAJ1866221.1 hypothetical protein LPJ78_002044 [Coemansia sp. RSA 989]KAJ1873450.1 hypothetical protein LPJ55_002305 [Coemansia sp. RSA 990]KAJ2633293.1 hypothetical protein H4R22_000577 [Coemansia sp. RSA 1290]KAJ2647946.1 hypothetical protein IWW40_004269 [Coemansia sp. RSA 1250]KAJ26700
MFVRPVISPEVLDELMGKNYLIVFFPKVHVTNYLEFRFDTSPLCWHLIGENLENYTALRGGWVTYLQQTRGVKVSHGVAFFKRGVLKKELEGFDEKKFLETLKEFDALNPNDPQPPSQSCCTCTVL